MTRFVVDASIACAWVLPDETSDIADAVFARLQNTRATAPDLLWHEARNVLMVTHRRKRIDYATVSEGMATLRTLPIDTLAFSDDLAILTLANRHNLTAYDAAYLALAIEMRLPLATLDKQLRAAAAREGVPLLA